MYGTYLKHHGIEGQKWGVRNGPPYPLSESQKSNSEKKLQGEYKAVNRKLINEIDDGIIDPDTGDVYKLADGGKIINKEVFAGKGVKKGLRDEVKEGLTERYGGTPDNWQHAKGSTELDYKGETRKAEVHWFQEETVGKVRYKRKKWLD